MSTPITVHIGDQVHEVTTLCGHSGELGAQGRELVARMVVDWAAGYGDLDVTVYGPETPDVDANYAEIKADKLAEEVP